MTMYNPSACRGTAIPYSYITRAGKFSSDSLYGHQGGVKALQLLPDHGLLATGEWRMGPTG